MTKPFVVGIAVGLMFAAGYVYADYWKGVTYNDVNGSYLVDGPLILSPVLEKPTCDSSMRGALWYSQNGALVADTTEICQKTALDLYVWKTLSIL